MGLVEEELVVIDLQTEGWPVIQTPYLVPLHSSAITCSHHVSAIPLKLWERVLAAGDLQNTHYSKKVRLGQKSNSELDCLSLILKKHSSIELAIFTHFLPSLCVYCLDNCFCHVKKFQK